MPADSPSLLFRVLDPASFGSGAADAAHLLGADDLPMRGEVRIRENLVRCQFFDDDIAALSLPIKAGRAGTLMLQTCVLPSREEPYLLLVELARHRIKHFVQKCEDWQMWDPDLARGAMRLWEEAREIFAQALLAPSASESEIRAKKSLERSIEASEHLAMSHAEILLHRRFGHRPASSTTLGVVARPSTPLLPKILETLQRDADVLQIPMNWREIEPKRGKRDYSAIDRWVNWAIEKKKPVMAGPLLDLREECLPDHARVFRHDYESFRNLAYDHLDALVGRYKNAIGIWNVGSGFHANAFFELSVDQMIDLARRVTVLVRQHNRKAHALIELVDPFGERLTRRAGSLPPWRYIELLQQEGITFSAVGVRLAMGRADAMARDLFQVSCGLDRFLGREARVLITGFGVPCMEVDPRGGSWRDGWTPKSQASWSGRVAHVALSKPFIDTLFWAEASDAAGPEARGYGLFDEHCQPRPVLERLVALRQRLRSPLGPRAATAAAASDDGGKADAE
ncbi:MAG: hypothetical protein U0572_15710 [Phycisphaerales bacterium]